MQSFKGSLPINSKPKPESLVRSSLSFGKKTESSFSYVESFSFNLSREASIRYEGLVEAKSDIAVFALSKKILGKLLDRCKYALPVRACKVLWAESQQTSAPRSIGWREGFKNFKYAP